MMARLRRWMIGLQVWAMAWVAAHIVATEPAPMQYRRPYGPAIWRATYWRIDRVYTVQFYRDGQCLGSGKDITPHRAYAAARRDARVRMHERGLRRRRQ